MNQFEESNLTESTLREVYKQLSLKGLKIEVQQALRVILRYSFRTSLEIEDIGELLKNPLYVIDLPSIIIPRQFIKLTVQTGINSFVAIPLSPVVERLSTEGLFDPADISPIVEVLSTEGLFSIIKTLKN